MQVRFINLMYLEDYVYDTSCKHALFIGENGAGKSKIIKQIEFFHLIYNKSHHIEPLDISEHQLLDLSNKRVSIEDIILLDEEAKFGYEIEEFGHIYTILLRLEKDERKIRLASFKMAKMAGKNAEEAFYYECDLMTDRKQRIKEDYELQKVVEKLRNEIEKRRVESTENENTKIKQTIYDELTIRDKDLLNLIDKINLEKRLLTDLEQLDDIIQEMNEHLLSEFVNENLVYMRIKINLFGYIQSYEILQYIISKITRIDSKWKDIENGFFEGLLDITWVMPFGWYKDEYRLTFQNLFIDFNRLIAELFLCSEKHGALVLFGNRLFSEVKNSKGRFKDSNWFTMNDMSHGYLKLNNLDDPVNNLSNSLKDDNFPLLVASFAKNKDIENKRCFWRGEVIQQLSILREEKVNWLLADMELPDFTEIELRASNSLKSVVLKNDRYHAVLTKFLNIKSPELIACFNRSIVELCDILRLELTVIDKNLGSLSCYVVRNEKRIAFESLSSGERHIITALLDLVTSEGIIYFKEVDVFLHPNKQSEFLRSVLELNSHRKSEHNMLIFETHSPYFLRELQLMRVENEKQAKVAAQTKVYYRSKEKVMNKEIYIKENGDLSEEIPTGFSDHLTRLNMLRLQLLD